MRRSIKRNNPPKAFAGAAFAIGSAITSLLGSTISSIGAKRQADAQRREQEYQNALVSAQSMTDAMNQSQALQDTYDRQNRMIVRRGGRRKMKYGGGYSSTGRMEQGVTSQFPLIPIAPGLYYDDSRRHESGGNKIKKNGKTVFEEEKGEVLDLRHGGEARVLSSIDELGTGNMSPADLALAGENPDVAYNIQESNKRCMRRKSIKKMRLGGWNEDWGTSGLKYGDAYNAGLNLVVNTGDTIAALSGINDLKRPSDLSLMSRSALPTRYNVATQLGATTAGAARSRDYVNRNSISSAAARSAMENINENEASQVNQLYGTKTNAENELIAKNTMYLDEGRQHNLNLINQHRQNLIDYANQRRALQSNALQTGIASLSDTVDNIDKTVNLRNQQDANMLASVMKSNPEGMKYSFAAFRPIAERLFGKKFVEEVLSSQLGTVLPNGNRIINGIEFDKDFFKKCGGRKSLKR